jgi:Cu/Ag efflux pump CusA
MVIFVPIVAGDSTIPKWVLAHVTSSRSRNPIGFLSEIRSNQIMAAILGLSVGLGLYQKLQKINFSVSAITPWLALQGIAIICLAMLVVRNSTQARKAYVWLNENEKWSELSALHEPAISRMVSGRITAIVFLLLALGIIAYWNFLS